MLDNDLFFSRNQRPAVSAGPLSLVWPFPLGLSGVTAIDWQAAVDMGRGQPIYAHFRVTTSFAEPASASQNSLQFCVVVDSVETFANVNANASLVIAYGPIITTAGLKAAVGGTTGAPATTMPTEVEIVVPVLSSLAIPGITDQGKRYLGLAMRAIVPANDWLALTAGGGVDAWLSPFPQCVRPASHVSGY